METDARTAPPAAPPPGFAHGFVQANDLRLHYVRGGTGRPLLLLHGFPATWYDWHTVMPELARDREVLAFDLPGLGDSQASAGPLSHDQAARYLADAVRTLRIGEHDLMAHDLGTWVAYPYARNFGEHLGKLVLLESKLAGYGLEDNFARPFTWHFAFHAGDPAFAARLLEGREHAYLDYFYDKFAHDPTALTQGTRQEFVRVYAQPGALERAFGYYAGIREAGERNLTLERKLEHPVLALGGQFAAGPSDASWRAVFTNVRAETLEGVGHYLVEEDPNGFLRSVQAFLD